MVDKNLSVKKSFSTKELPLQESRKTPKGLYPLVLVLGRFCLRGGR
jgi:hypothetical protein